MPNIKSAKKRVEISEANRANNRAYKSELATALKKFNAAVSAQDKELVRKLYPATVSLLDESVTRGIIHKNKADRKKAEVSSKYIAVATAKAKKPAKAEVKAEPAKAEEVKTEEKPAAEKKPAAKPAAAKAPKAAAKAKAEKAEKPAAEKKPAAKKATKAAEKPAAEKKPAKAEKPAAKK